MKRPMPADAKPGVPIYDLKKAYTKDQLAEIGAIALIYNEIEAMVDFQLMVVLELSPQFWMETVKRINGMDGKIEILRICANDSDILDDEAKQCIKICLDAILEYKKLRDSIVHSRPFDSSKFLAMEIASRAKVSQIIVSQEGLEALYQRMKQLIQEFREVDLLFRIEKMDRAATLSHPHRDPEKQQRIQGVQSMTLLVRNLQNVRLSLPPLPVFQDSSPALKATGRKVPHPNREAGTA